MPGRRAQALIGSPSILASLSRTTGRSGMEMADATLSSSTASDQVYGRGHQTLPSFASSFRSEDYDRPPAGIAQADWARLARGRNPSRDEDDSSLQRGTDDSLEYGYAREGRARSTARGGTASPASTTTTTTAPADNRRTAPISLDSSTVTVAEAANTFEEDDSVDVGDRTETTRHHLQSGVLDLSSSAAGGGASSSSRLGGDDSSSFANVYGGGGLRTATRDLKSGGGGGAMTLREQEKVRQGRAVSPRESIRHADQRRLTRSSQNRPGH